MSKVHHHVHKSPIMRLHQMQSHHIYLMFPFCTNHHGTQSSLKANNSSNWSRNFPPWWVPKVH